MIDLRDIQALVNASILAGFTVDLNRLQLLHWPAGVETHNPLALPRGFSGIYIFKHNDEFLKVGKAGLGNTPRYKYHHYDLKAPSTLAKSLVADPEYSLVLGNQSPKDWICENSSRFNILIPEMYNKHFVNFAEAFFILRCNPRFEG